MQVGVQFFLRQSLKTAVTERKKAHEKKRRTQSFLGSYGTSQTKNLGALYRPSDCQQLLAKKKMHCGAIMQMRVLVYPAGRSFSFFLLFRCAPEGARGEGTSEETRPTGNTKAAPRTNAATF